VAGFTFPDAPNDGNTYSRNNAAWTNLYDSLAGTVLKFWRSVTPGSRPSGRTYGEPYVNLGDNQFGVFDSSNVARDLIGVPVFSSAKAYPSGQAVTNAGVLYISNTAVSAGSFNSAQWSQVMMVSGGQTITGGFILAPASLGNIASFTPNPLLGNYQYGTNHGAATWTAPTSDCAMDILVTNDATAGAITFSGFTVGTATGDPLTTVNGNKFIISIRRINAISTYTVKALQ
jgi:hypothetical protein